jgi:hypothetical protein
MEPTVQRLFCPARTWLPFKELHQKVIAELSPVGPLEDDIVATITRLLWRKQNFATFRLAELASEYEAAIRKEKLPAPLTEIVEFGVLSGEREAALQASEDQARKELGDRYALVEIGAAATVDRLWQDLAIVERLDAMIDKCQKRLLHLRALKSLPSSPPL